MSIPILLICGCQKYKDSLTNALLRFDNPVYKTVGLIGDLTQKTSFDGKILTLEVEDTYEYLPKKIYMALKWVLINYPDTQGVFKTDDDIYVKDTIHFTNILVTNVKIPWWGFKMEPLKNNAFPDTETSGKHKYTNRNITGHTEIKKGLYLWGAGYWLSNTLLSLICNTINYPEVGREDLIIANVIRDAGFLPIEIKTGWTEIVRDAKCNITGCLYKINTNSKIGFAAYCCSKCMISEGNAHGPRCEKTKFRGLLDSEVQTQITSDTTVLDTKPILLICGCQKYKSTLISAIKRFNNPAYKTIGLLGDLEHPTSFDGEILTLQVEDTYEYLPKKIHTALKWVLINYPYTKGVFKTDDDICIKDISNFAYILQKNTNKPWWGFKKAIDGGPSNVSLLKYNDTNNIPYVGKKGVLLYGAGYWISRALLSFICNYKKYPEVGSEDQIISEILRNNGHSPEMIKIKWNELRRYEKCKNEECLYVIHTDKHIGNGLYCCKGCIKSLNHGSKCEKIIYVPTSAGVLALY